MVNTVKQESSISRRDARVNNKDFIGNNLGPFMRKESHCHYPIAFVDTWICLIAPGYCPGIFFRLGIYMQISLSYASPTRGCLSREARFG